MRRPVGPRIARATCGDGLTPQVTSVDSEGHVDHEYLQQADPRTYPLGAAGPREGPEDRARRPCRPAGVFSTRTRRHTPPDSGADRR